MESNVEAETDINTKRLHRLNAIKPNTFSMILWFGESGVGSKVGQKYGTNVEVRFFVDVSSNFYKLEQSAKIESYQAWPRKWNVLIQYRQEHWMMMMMRQELTN